MTEILAENTIENRSESPVDEQPQEAAAAAAAAAYYYPPGMNLALNGATAGSPNASTAASTGAAAGTNPASAAAAVAAGYPYYYQTPDGTSALSDPAAAAAAATAAAMAASAAYGLPSLSAVRRTRHAMDVGPYFKATKQISSVYSMDRTRNYTIRLLPRLDKGFFLADNDWTCYRRNYFQLTCSYTCTDSTGMKIELPCLVDVEGRGLRTVTEFQIIVTARTANGTREVDLVQHTAKRDKGPQAVPTPKRCDPQDLTPNYGMRPDSEAFHSVTFERIQFKSATANNGKRRAAQQYHTIVVELLAKCDDGYMARIATTESAPLVVRGRAPGHYHAMASKEAQENAESMGHFPYYPPHAGDGSAHYYPMVQSGYYYHPYYWANMAAGANAAVAAASAEQLAALSGQVSEDNAAAMEISDAGQAEGGVDGTEEQQEQGYEDQQAQEEQVAKEEGDDIEAPGHEGLAEGQTAEVTAQEEEEVEEEPADQGESANMTEATATGTPENEMVDDFDNEKVKRTLEEGAEESPKKRRGRPKRVAA